MSKKLLIEHPIIYYIPKKLLSEGISTLNDGNILLKDVLVITAESENGNGRYYKRELWEREIDNFQRKIEEGTTETIGELDHPDSEIINLKNGSHIIRKLEWRGNNVYADMEVLCSQGPKGNISGRILGSYLLNGLAVGFSTRGLGSLEENSQGLLEVQDDFEFTTIDSVSNPSNAGSFGRITESMNLNIKNNDIYTGVKDSIRNILCSHGSCPTF